VEVALLLLGQGPEFLVHFLNEGLVHRLVQARDVGDPAAVAHLGTDDLADGVGVEAGELGELLDRGLALLHPAGEVHLLLQRQEGDLADLVKVLADRVGGGDPGGEDLLLFLLERKRLPALVRDDVHALALEVVEHLLERLLEGLLLELGHGLLHRRPHLLLGEGAGLLAFLEKFLNRLVLEHAGFHGAFLLAHRFPL